MGARAVSPKAAAARRYLVGLVREEGGRLTTYGELGGAIGYPPRSMAKLLDEVFDDCRSHHEPDITVLVINQRTQLPGKFRGAYTVDGAFDRAAWQAELTAVRTQNWDA